MTDMAVNTGVSGSEMQSHGGLQADMDGGGGGGVLKLRVPLLVLSVIGFLVQIKRV